MVTVPQPGNPTFASKGPFASDPQKGYMALFKRRRGVAWLPPLGAAEEAEARRGSIR